MNGDSFNSGNLIRTVSRTFFLFSYLVLLATISIILPSAILWSIFLKCLSKGIVILQASSFRWLLSLKAQVIVWLPDISPLMRNKHENGEKKDLAEMPKSKRTACGDQPTFVALEQKLVDWILNCALMQVIITHTAIWIKVPNLLKMLEFTLKKSAKFAASSGWYNRFMSRHNLCIKTWTKLVQKLPSQLENKVAAFQGHVIQLRKKYDFDLSQIGNMDETLISFDMPANYTIEVESKQLRQKYRSWKMPFYGSFKLHGWWKQVASNGNILEENAV